MKRCPECKSLFSDTENFCEIDGTPLSTEVISQQAPPAIPQMRPKSNTILIVGVVLGLVFGILPVLVYMALTRGRDGENANQRAANTSVAQSQFPQRVVAPPPPLSSPSPSAEPSPSPSAETSPTPQPTQPRIELSSSAISTAAKDKSGPVVITLQSGNTIEAEEAWQTKEGIWYRRSGVIALLDPKDVKSVERSKPAPSTSPSPAASPKPSVQ